MIGWLGGRVVVVVAVAVAVAAAAVGVVVVVVVVVVVCLTNLRALATLYSTKRFEDYSR